MKISGLISEISLGIQGPVLAWVFNWSSFGTNQLQLLQPHFVIGQSIFSLIAFA